MTGGIDPNTNKPVQGSINTKGVSEIVTGTSQGPIDAGRVRSIVETMKEAKDSGNKDMFAMAIVNLKDELKGRLEGNEDKVLGHFGFALDESKEGKSNQAFFDKAREGAVVTGKDTADKDLIMSLDGSGRDEERAKEIDKDIDKARERIAYLDKQIAGIGDQFGKKIPAELQRSEKYARAMADGLLKSAESTSGLVDVAAAVDKLRIQAKEIIEKDAARIKKFAGDIKFALDNIGIINEQLDTISGGLNPATPPTPAAVED